VSAPEVVHVCTFTLLDELPSKRRGDVRAVLAALAEAKRFSVFEATSDGRLARSLEKVHDAGWIRYVPMGFPWTGVELTDLGRAVLAEHLESLRVNE
jgi:hypothetical protein